MSSVSSFSPLVASLHVAIGGAVGAVLRYQTGRAMTAWLGAPAMSVFPWATLAVNALGSLLMGMLAGWLARHGNVGSEQLRLLLGVGLLGGFTTFSAFSLESALMIERGQAGLAALYIGGSVAAGVLALFAGLRIAA
jgi:CrcB protein